MTPLRVGLVGCGDIAELRAQALRKNPALTLASVADIDTALASAFARRQGLAQADSWEQMIQRADVAAVVICTPPASHADLTIAALRAGKHVLCEKPLARSAEECQRMIDAARENSRILATGFNYRFYPSVMKARQIFDSGEIGDLDHIRAYTGYTATAHNRDWLRDPEVVGGGTLRDNGIHLIDTVLYFLGEPVEIKGFATSSVWNFPGCEDNGFALLRNARGNVASLHSSWTEWRKYKFLVEVYGTKGCIRIHCFPMITELITGDIRTSARRTQRSFFPFVHVMEHLKSYRWIVVQSFVREFSEFCAAIEGRTTAIATGQDGLRSIQVAQVASRNVAAFA